ncbi:MAG: hypothetical protein K8S98_13270 [Planctomycetes bacterium]|nr:hypothetical protein [Planctomycetota bacterium]
MPDAGSVHFAVLSVAPWDEIREQLAPNFELTPAQAYAEAVGTTQSMESAVLNFLGASVGGRSTRDLDSGARSAVTTPGTAAAPPKVNTVAPPPSLSTGTSIDLPQGANQAPNAGIGIDPMTRYWTAAALYQEVQLLGQYIQHAAVRDGYTAFLVRLQVTLMPKARNEPYDAYTTISFFPSGDGERANSGAHTRSLDKLAFPSTPGAGPQVIPLLVNDNLEASLQVRQQQSVTQVAAAIEYFREGLAAGGGVQSVNADSQQAFGNDLNSLLSVARLSDNTIRVRLGAMQQASARYAMVPRNHNVTVLVMVPQGTCRGMQALARTTLVDALSGTDLPDRTEDAYDAEFDVLRRRFEMENVSDATLRTLLSLAQSNAHGAFRDLFEVEVARGDERLKNYWQALWVDLLALTVGSPYAATTFELPGLEACDGEAVGPKSNARAEAKPRAWPFAATHFVDAIVGDQEGRATWRVELASLEPIEAADVRANLVAAKGRERVADGRATRCAFDSIHKTLQLDFDALAGVADDPEVTLALELSIGTASKTLAVSLR